MTILASDWFIIRYFCSLDMPIQELLGSSETSGPQTASTPGPGIR